MGADVKLEKEEVIIEGNYLRLKPYALMLDNSDRRDQNKKNLGERRALVHDLNDGLTINYDADYPGGVKIRGNLTVESLQSNDLQVSNVNVGGLVRIRTLSGPMDYGYEEKITIKAPNVYMDSSLRVFQEATFDESIKTRDVIIAPKIGPAEEGKPEYQPYSLSQRIKELEHKIQLLEKRVSLLEKK